MKKTNEQKNIKEQIEFLRSCIDDLPQTFPSTPEEFDAYMGLEDELEELLKGI